MPLQASIKSGQGTPDIVVDFGNKSGLITVQTENDCGMSSIQTYEVAVEQCDNNGVVINNPPNSGGNLDDPLMNGSEHMFFPEVIASTGGFASGKHSTLSWTLGESVIETINDDHMMISQGFHQSYYEIIALGGLNEGSGLEVEVYPVPTKSDVNIHITSDAEQVNLNVELYDLLGNMIYKENVKSHEFNYRIDLSTYPAKVFYSK